MKKITDARTETYLHELKTKGAVTMEIHPEHLENILKLKKIADDSADDKVSKRAISELADKKHEVAREELWMTVKDSFDSTMKAIDDASGGAILKLKEGRIMFRSKLDSLRSQGERAMKDLGIPSDVMEDIIKVVQKKAESDGLLD